MSLFFLGTGMIPVSRLLLHRTVKAPDSGFLQFLMNMQFRESGPGAVQGHGIDDFFKSTGARVISDIMEMSAGF